MKKEIYIVEIEMPDGDTASSMYIRDVIQSDCDVEDEGRWKVSVKEFWKPSDTQLRQLELAIDYWKPNDTEVTTPLFKLWEDLRKLKAGKL